MQIAEVQGRLARLGTTATRKGMARYGIVAQQAYGVPMGSLLTLAREIGPNHRLAIALWNSGWYEARLLAALIGEAERVTVREMNAWARGFENWGDCDTVCFKLWDQSPHAWSRATAWAASKAELVRRGGFVLMACLALHDRGTPDRPFLAFLRLLERGADDDRHLVAKAITWALRSIGGRDRQLHEATTAVARRLAASTAPAPRAVGKEALRDLRNPKLLARLARQAR